LAAERTAVPEGDARLTVGSPVGALTLTQREDAIVRIAWTGGNVPLDSGPAPTLLLARAATQLGEYFAGTRRDFDLPLAPAGSAFQARVWAEMSKIPWGRTLSYGEIAAKLGSAPRAVGGACGANPIPIVIPCHRVLAGKGKLGGYSGGAGPATKRILLELEGAPPGEADLFAAL
jgi:methylated-DNA-[protein]-cysteine S-methyltransferase